MSRSTALVTVWVVLVLLGLAIVGVVTAKPLRMPTPFLARRTATVSVSSSDDKWEVSAVCVPPPLPFTAHFSSKQDALAAEKLVREALKWADPKIRVMGAGK